MHGLYTGTSKRHNLQLILGLHTLITTPQGGSPNWMCKCQRCVPSSVWYVRMYLAQLAPLLLQSTSDQGLTKISTASLSFNEQNVETADGFHLSIYLFSAPMHQCLAC